MAIKAQRFAGSVSDILREHAAEEQERGRKTNNISEILGELYEAS